MDGTVEEKVDNTYEGQSNGDSYDESVIMNFQFAMAEIGMYDNRSILSDT